MLQELVVENYAVVERLRMHFHAGLNLLTGETGSGKSIVVDALGLLLGGRASADMVRTGESRARVAGIFDVRDHTAIRRLLEPSGLEIEDGELLVEREILAGGKSRAFVGSRPGGGLAAQGTGAVPGRNPRTTRPAASVLRRRPARHAGRFRRPTATCWTASPPSTRSGEPRRAELEELERGEQEKLRLLDLWSFQRKEIEERRAAARRRRGARKRTPHPAERAAIGGSRGHGLRGGVRRAGIGPLADARGGRQAWTSCAASTPRWKVCAST